VLIRTFPRAGVQRTSQVSFVDVDRRWRSRIAALRAEAAGAPTPGRARAAAAERPPEPANAHPREAAAPSYGEDSGLSKRRAAGGSSHNDLSGRTRGGCLGGRNRATQGGVLQLWAGLTPSIRDSIAPGRVSGQLSYDTRDARRPTLPTSLSPRFHQVRRRARFAGGRAVRLLAARGHRRGHRATSRVRCDPSDPRNHAETA